MEGGSAEAGVAGAAVEGPRLHVINFFFFEKQFPLSTATQLSQLWKVKKCNNIVKGRAEAAALAAHQAAEVVDHLLHLE